MNLRVVGCTHHEANLDVRQRLAFDRAEAATALADWQSLFPNTELVLLCTCNRVELYAAAAKRGDAPDPEKLIEALIGARQLSRKVVASEWLSLIDSAVVEHLFRVAASLESMVIGESQILAQVKQAYRVAQETGVSGPLMHELFQSALHTAKRVSGESSLHKHRVSIPSVAIAELASSVFETFDDKHVLVIGAGKMADETLRYLREAGQARIHVVNRSRERGESLAKKWAGQFHPWKNLWDQLSLADLAISTSGASESIVSAVDFRAHVVPRRHQRPMFILDLALPRDFDPAVGDALGVYLYSLDDLDRACQRNREARAAELPVAERIIAEEAGKFLAQLRHRASVPVITGLRAGLERPKSSELERLFQRLPHLDEQEKREIQQFADRLVNKMLHPPLESLRDASRNGNPHGLLDALRRLFKLED